MFVVFVLPRNVTLQIHSPMKHNLFPVRSHTRYFELHNFGLPICGYASSFMIVRSLLVSNCILKLVVSILTLINFLFVVQSIFPNDNLFIFSRLIQLFIILIVQVLLCLVPHNENFFLFWNGHSLLMCLPLHAIIHGFISDCLSCFGRKLYPASKTFALVLFVNNLCFAFLLCRALLFISYIELYS